MMIAFVARDHRCRQAFYRHSCCWKSGRCAFVNVGRFRLQIAVMDTDEWFPNGGMIARPTSRKDGRLELRDARRKCQSPCLALKSLVFVGNPPFDSSN